MKLYNLLAILNICVVRYIPILSSLSYCSILNLPYTLTYLSNSVIDICSQLELLEYEISPKDSNLKAKILQILEEEEEEEEEEEVEEEEVA